MAGINPGGDTHTEKLQIQSLEAQACAETISQHSGHHTKSYIWWALVLCAQTQENLTLRCKACYPSLISSSICWIKTLGSEKALCSLNWGTFWNRKTKINCQRHSQIVWTLDHDFCQTWPHGLRIRVTHLYSPCCSSCPLSFQHDFLAFWKFQISQSWN